MFEIDEGLKDKFTKCQKEITRELIAKDKLKNKRTRDKIQFKDSFISTLDTYLNKMCCGYVLWKKRRVSLYINIHGNVFIQLSKEKLVTEHDFSLSYTSFYNNFGTEGLIELINLAKEKAEKKYASSEKYAQEADMAEAINEVFLEDEK